MDRCARRCDATFWGLLALLLAVLVGCGTVETTVRPSLPSFVAPAIDPLPLRVAYGFADDLDTPRVHRVGSSDNPTAVHSFEVGAASRATFERLIPALFAEAVPAAAAPGTAGTIVIALAKAHGQRFPQPAYATVGYTLTFMEPDGSVAGTWQVDGQSKRDGTLDDEMALAMRKAASRVAFEIGNQPAVVRWLERAAPGHDAVTTGPTERD